MIFKRIKQVREALKFSKQEDFSMALDIPNRTYQSYEQGKVKVIPHTFLEKLNTQYHVSFDWLLTGKGDMFITNEPYANIENTSNLLVEKKSSFEEELFNDIKKLSPKRQEYYYHRIKADLIEDELKSSK